MMKFGLLRVIDSVCEQDHLIKVIFFSKVKMRLKHKKFISRKLDINILLKTKRILHTQSMKRIPALIEYNLNDIEGGNTICQ